MMGVTAILVLLAAQASAPAAAPAQTAAGGAMGMQGPLFGGIPTGTATAEPMPLSLSDAIDRGLQHNLALVLSEQGVRSARGTRLEALGDVLPHLNGRFSAVRQKINLEAFGFSGFP